MFNRSAQVHRETKGRDNTLGRHCANRARLRRQGASAPTERNTKGSKTKSPFCVVLKTYHLNTWILHKTCLKHSNFLHRKILCTWNIMATAMGQGTEETQRVETRFKIQQFQHSSITRALCSPWPQRGVDFVARECCEHNFTIAARDLTGPRRTKV